MSEVTILTVDDSTMNRRIVRRIAEELGHNVLEAPDGKTALSILAENADKIQLVILDMMMPGMTGTDVLKAIRAKEEYNNIRVMMLTSEAEQSFVFEALKAGADNYLTKPIKKNVLDSRIQEFVKEID